MQDNNNNRNMNNNNRRTVQRSVQSQNARPVSPQQRPGQPQQRPMSPQSKRQAMPNGQPRQMTQNSMQGRPMNPNQPQRRPQSGNAGGGMQQGRPLSENAGLVQERQQNGQQRRPHSGVPRQTGNAQYTTSKKKNKVQKANKSGMAPQNKDKKKRKIALFIVEILVIVVLIAAFWGVTQANKIKWVDIKEDDIVINEEVKEITNTGVMKGYRNIALFGVDSREGDLDKNTRTDTIMIASINLDTKEVKLVSVYRDTWLNLSTDKYGKANSAYAKGGPAQAINMLNMNLDMNITDYVTVGFAAVIDVIDAVGGLEIDVKESEIVHLNSYQISMVGRPDGTLNAAGEPNYTATAGVDYTPVTRSGVQTLNGLQALAYSRIRYVGDDFERTERQRTVVQKFAKKAITINPNTLTKIADAVFPKISTSLDLTEIISLLADVDDYQISENAGFPFDDSVKTGKVGTASVVIPVDLEKNVRQLHEFFFNETDYEPSEIVKGCSRKIVSDTGVSASQ